LWERIEVRVITSIPSTPLRTSSDLPPSRGKESAKRFQMPRIRDIAVICRSKNASPFLLTLDMVFPDRETFDKVRASEVISKGLISRLYSVAEKDVLLVEFPPANAIKATIPRLHGSGDVEDTDVYGAQQHAPLMDVEIPF